MLLVDDDQRETRQCAEHRQARAEDELRLAARGGGPVGASRSVGEPAVQRYRAGTGKRGAHARLELRRQVDFRDEQQHLTASRDRGFCRSEIDGRLATAPLSPLQSVRHISPHLFEKLPLFSTAFTHSFSYFGHMPRR